MNTPACPTTAQPQTRGRRSRHLRPRRVEHPEDLTPTQRVGLVVYWLMLQNGEPYTTAELAWYLGITWTATWKMLRKLTASVPIAETCDGWVIYLDPTW